LLICYSNLLALKVKTGVFRLNEYNSTGRRPPDDPVFKQASRSAGDNNDITNSCRLPPVNDVIFVLVAYIYRCFFRPSYKMRVGCYKLL